MGTGPRLGAGRTLPPAGPKLLQGEKTEWGRVGWNYHAPSGSQLWRGDSSIPGRVHSW